MRVYFLIGLISLFAIAGIRDWFIGVCGLLLLSVIVEHPDFPNAMGGIMGANPWNLLLLWITILALLDQKSARDMKLAPPVGKAPTLFMAYVLVVTASVGYSLIAFNMPPSTGYDRFSFFIEHWINPMKMLVLAYLVYRGARTPQRQAAAAGCVVISFLLLTLLVLKYRLSVGLGTDFMRGRNRLGKEIGMHANQVGWMLGGMAWGLLAFSMVWRRRLMRWLTAFAAAAPALGVLVVQSRAGYLALAATGLVFGAARWRKLLILLPLGAAAVLFFVPAVRDRLLMGIDTEGTPTGEVEYDWETISASRTTAIWPPVIEQIWASPLLGHGRVAILRTPAKEQIEEILGGGCPEHPHNSYLELLIDTGVVGTIVVLAFYFGFFLTCWRIFRLRASPLAAGIGGMALALLASRLVSGVSGCSLFPIRSMYGLFALGGLAVRLAAAHPREKRPPKGRVAARTGRARVIRPLESALQPG